MSIMTKLSAAIKQLISSKKSVDLASVRSNVDDVMSAAAAITTPMTARDRPTVQAMADKAATLNSGQRSLNPALVDAWSKMRKSLVPATNAFNNRMPMGGLVEACSRVQADLAWLEDNWVEVFGKDTVTLDDDSMRMSHMMVLSYLRSASRLTMWVTNGLLAISDKSTRTYHTDSMHATTFQVAEFVNMLFSTNLQTIVSNMRKANTDGRLAMNGQPMTDHMSDSDIARGASPLVTGFNPFLFVGDVVITINRKFYEWRRNQKDFVEAMIRKLVLEKQGLSPDDPEVKRIDAIIARYQAQLALLTDQIRKYEEGAR